ncbi:MAG TPA: hypothetical protein VNV37_09265 [Solirubrobacteraceae bacterium]|nr:hypothetical protein [Solirubrobacteraceae bacterium]
MSSPSPAAKLSRSKTRPLAEHLEGRIQTFDQPAAIAAGTIAANRQRAARTLEIRNLQIAASPPLAEQPSRHATSAISKDSGWT